MHRLVIASTAFLTLVGAVVVAGYLFVFAAQPDRNAQAVPAGSSAYVTVYLQPSAGQKMSLAGLLGRVPGFADAASLDQKIHEITARMLGEAGIDYEADLRPWLGNQVSVAAWPDGLDPEAADTLAVVAVRDRQAAADALPRLAEDLGQNAAPQDHQGVELMVGEEVAWTLLEDVLLVGSGPEIVSAALDAEAGRVPSLADSARFTEAMTRVPADHLASVYLDMSAAADTSGADDQLGGYSTASLALVAEADGLVLSGNAPFDADAAPAQAREAFALASQPSSLSDWMPADTQGELVVFGLSQTLQAAEEQLGAQDVGGEIAQALTQVRVLAAVGLGINLDRDVLPLFDRETAVAVSGLDTEAPHGQLLLRPSDPDAAESALRRMTDALRERGARVEEDQVDGVTLTTVDVPELTSLAYAVQDGVVVVGLGQDDVAAALRAHAEGEALSETDRYRDAWRLAGDRGGNELWLDAAAMVDAAGDDLGVTGEARDILLEIGAVAMTAPARDEHTEFHVVLTVR